MDRMEQVKHLRTDPGGRHYNCAQSILVPFAGEAGLEEEQAYQLGAMFGSGMNHGATCGVHPNRHPPQAAHRRADDH